MTSDFVTLEHLFEPWRAYQPLSSRLIPLPQWPAFFLGPDPLGTLSAWRQQRTMGGWAEMAYVKSL